MSDQRPGGWSRREFLAKATLAGAAGFLGIEPSSFAAEPPPETKRLRLVSIPAICVAPEYVAEDLLKGEGFSELQYVKKDGTVAKQQALAAGEVDLTLHFSAPLLTRIDAGDPIVILAGVHVGCFELIGTERVRSIRDLRGKTVAVHGLGSAEHVFLASITAYVGLDPRQDIHWVTYPVTDAIRLPGRRED
jgi:NitT/TauT family transport system substrate-binding protein